MASISKQLLLDVLHWAFIFGYFLQCFDHIENSRKKGGGLSAKTLAKWNNFVHLDKKEVFVSIHFKIEDVKTVHSKTNFSILLHLAHYRTYLASVLIYFVAIPFEIRNDFLLKLSFRWNFPGQCPCYIVANTRRLWVIAPNNTNLRALWAYEKNFVNFTIELNFQSIHARILVYIVLYFEILLVSI